MLFGPVTTKLNKLYYYYSGYVSVANVAFYDFCGFRSVAVNSVYKLQFFYIYIMVCLVKNMIVVTACVDCRKHQFKCPNTGLCIPATTVCNGLDDCGDGSDEVAKCSELSLSIYRLAVVIVWWLS